MKTSEILFVCVVMIFAIVVIIRLGWNVAI